MKRLIRVDLDAYSEDKNGFTTAPVVRLDFPISEPLGGDYIEKRSADELQKMGFDLKKDGEALFWHRDFNPEFKETPYTCLTGVLDFKENYGWIAKMSGKEEHLKRLDDLKHN